MTSTSAPKDNHHWRFSRIGGIDMVRLDQPADLQHLSELDQKLWSTLASPVQGLELDTATLLLIDQDKDGRIRAPEILAAVEWACASLKHPGLLKEGRDALPIDAIQDPVLAKAAVRILCELELPKEGSISLANVQDLAKALSRTKFNGDGIVTPESAGEDTETADLIRTIVATQGSCSDRSGKPGVDQGKVDSFFAEAAAWLAWQDTGAAQAATIFPMGDKTASAHTSLQAIRKKVDDYFGRCRLAAFDPRAVAALNRQESEFLALAAKDLTITADEIMDFPLAHVEPGQDLPLDTGLNPAWQSTMTRFCNEVVIPVFGESKKSLTEEDWASLKSKLAPYAAWLGAKAGASVESLGWEPLQNLLKGDGKEKIAALIAEDLALAPQFAAIAAVEKLLRYSRDLYRLLNNFVSLYDLYDPNRMAVFQAGILYLDGRSCNLVIKVSDPAKHAALAGLSKAYLAYCDCKRPATGETMQVVAAFTNGDSDFLMVGRNGVFYDRQGRDWDATISRVVENPMSIRQAFFSPYKKLVRMIEEQAAKRAATAEAASDTKLASAASMAANADQAPKPAPKKIDVGTVAAIGVAASAAVAVLTAIIGGILGLSWWQIPLAVIGVLLLISGPSMIIAALKLRQRTLGPILEANGWAINSRIKINIPFGTSLTAIAKLPKGAEHALDDPFGQKRTPWKRYVLLLLLITSAVWTWWDYRTKGHFFWQEPPAEEAPGGEGMSTEELTPVDPQESP